MSRTLTAMFDSRAEAETARMRLRDAGVGESDVRLVDQDSGKATTGAGQTSARGMWEQFKDLFVPDDDAHGYAEGVRRGGTILTARVDDRDADRVAGILDNTSAVDFDAREASWRGEGWTGGSMAPAPARNEGRDSGRSRVRSYRADEIHAEERAHAAATAPRDATSATMHKDPARDRPAAALGAGSWVSEELLVRRSADGRIEAIAEPVRLSGVEMVGSERR